MAVLQVLIVKAITDRSNSLLVMLLFKAMQVRLPTLTTADLDFAHTSYMKFVRRKELFRTRP